MHRQVLAFVADAVIETLQWIAWLLLAFFEFALVTYAGRRVTDSISRSRLRIMCHAYRLLDIVPQRSST